MSVSITVKWSFVRSDDERPVEVTYGSSVLEEDDQAHDEPLLEEQTSVVPLGSSVLAPGLSMPVARA